MERLRLKKLFLFLFLILVLVFTTSCVKSLVQSCRELATKPLEKEGIYGFTEEQAKAACAYGNRFIAGKFDKDTKLWSIDYANFITIEDVLKYVDDSLLSTDQLLSYEDKYMVRWIDFFEGFREALEKQEDQKRWVKARLTYVKNYNKFVDEVGEIDSGGVKKLLPHGRKAYSLRLFYPQNTLRELRFVADYIESAKANDNLQLVNQFTFLDQKEFAEKIVEKDDIAKFKWKEHHRGWLIKAYKICTDGEPPIKSDIDYLEVYTANFKKVAGSTEFDSFNENFVVSGFKSKDSETVNIFVVDYDYSQVVGFSPDNILKFYDKITKGNELYEEEGLKTALLDVHYDPPVAEEKEHRKKPQQKPLYVEVVKMGQVSDKIKLWEENEKGFTVPFKYSAHDPGKFEIETKVHWKKPETPEEKEILKNRDLKQIEYFKMFYKKGFTLNASVKVIEYYIPKEQYSKRDVKSFYSYSGQITIQRLDQPEEKASIKYFSEKVEAIDYEHGDRWYRIYDEDGDGVYEKRRKIANPNEQKKQESSYRGYR